MSVNKLLADLIAAEREKTAPPPPDYHPVRWWKNQLRLSACSTTRWLDKQVEEQKLGKVTRIIGGRLSGLYGPPMKRK